jgi:TetR/AcrR family transcriptional regulator, transcriptional repressor for nem operon
MNYTRLNYDDKPKNRIIQAAYRLFYRNGYSETGINEILELSDSHKASLYRYFNSKDSLGRYTLTLEKKRFLSFLARALDKYRNYRIFVHFWVRIVRRTMTASFSHGCPFVRYSQTAGETNFSGEIIREVFSEAEQLLAAYFTRNYHFKTQKAVQTARKALAAYEGAVQMVLLSADPVYFSIMEDMLLSAVTV